MIPAALGALFLFHFGFISERAKHERPFANIVALSGDEHRAPCAEGKFIERVIGKASNDHVQSEFVYHGIQDNTGRSYGTGWCIIASDGRTIADANINGEGKIARIDSKIPDLILLGPAETIGIELCFVLPEWQSSYVYLCRVAEQRQLRCTDRIEVDCWLAPKIAVHEPRLKRFISTGSIDERDSNRTDQGLTFLFHDIELISGGVRLPLNFRVNLLHFADLITDRPIGFPQGDKRYAKDEDSKVIPKYLAIILSFFFFAVGNALILYGVYKSREIGGWAVWWILAGWSFLWLTFEVWPKAI